MTTTGTAIVGYGYWGVNLARNIAAAPSLELIAIADGDVGRRTYAAERHPGIGVCETLDQVLADSRVEAVVLAVPASLHATLALEVLSADRHVMVEKPLAMTVDDAERVVSEAATRNRVAMVGHTFLYSSPVKWLASAIQAGELGKVQYLSSQRLSLGRIRRDCNALWNFAPHDISIMLHLLGERPIEVSGRGFCFIEPPIDDVFFGSLEFESGIGANIHVSWIDPRKTRLLTVVGDQKMAVYDDVSADQKVSVVDAGVARNDELGSYESMGDFQWRTRAGDIHIPHIPMTEPLAAEMEAFGLACQGGPTLPTDARHGADVVRILVALDESAQQRGVPVRIEW